MSRSGYSDDFSEPESYLYRGTVTRSLRGKRGQKTLRDLLAALDAMPDKRLGAGSFRRGECPCTLGALAAHRGVDVSDIEPVEDPNDDDWVDADLVGSRFDIARCMAAEIMYENDEQGDRYEPPSEGDTRGKWRAETPEERWQRMRDWAARQLVEEVPKP